MSAHRSAAWPHLCALQVGDPVPAECYVLDYADGTRPLWTVSSVRELRSGGRHLILVDPDTSSPYLFDDLFQGVALSVVTHPGKTMRSQPYRLGYSPGPTLCDMDQQARHAEAGHE